MPRPVSRTSSADPAPSSVSDAGDRDPATGRRVAEGVGDEVGEDLADPDRVDVEDRQIPLDGGVELDARRGRGRLERAHDVADEDVGIGRFAVEGERPGLGQRQRPQVVDQPAEDPRLVEDQRRGAPGRADRRRR